jgi:hypothetical protein
MSMNDEEPSVMGAGVGRPLMPTEADRREAYKRLYVGRMVARGIDQEDAEASFEAGEVDYDIDPESAVDDELSYWDNDE